LRKKKVLFYGTPDTLKKFLADAVNHEFEIVALLNDNLQNFFSRLEVFTPQTLPQFAYEIVDGIILADNAKSSANFFLFKGIEPRKIILYDTEKGWLPHNMTETDGTKVTYFGGLEFHIRNPADEKFFQGIQGELRIQRAHRNLNPSEYGKLVAQDFQRKRKRPLDFNNLQTFTEKLNWLKVFDATPLKGRLADKYAVRSWVAEKIGDEYLIPLLGAWDDFDDINFEDLPNQFVLKCSHSWNTNIIVRDKSKFDKQNARERINAWLRVDHGILGFELHYSYSYIRRKIIAEKFMTNGDLPDLSNYRFWCFDGKPIYCGLDNDFINPGRMDYFYMDWKPTEFENAFLPHSEHPEEIPPPKNFELMKKLAAKLAADFAFVRVDFYEIEGKVYMGEMTFTPGSAHFYYKNEKADEYLGSLVKLPVASAPPPRYNFAA